MWTDTTRAQYARAEQTLPSDLTDAEWAVLEPFFPRPSHFGRPCKWPMRQIIEAILYLLRGGLPCRMLPPCFAPVSTVRRWFYLWRDNGLWLSLNHTLLLMAREARFGKNPPLNLAATDCDQYFFIDMVNFDSVGTQRRLQVITYSLTEADVY